jgi:hypothetical protein
MQYDKTSHSAGHHLHPVDILISNFSKICFMSFFHLSQQLPIPLFTTDFPPNNFETFWCAPRVQNILPNFFSPIYFTNGVKSQGAKNFQKSRNKLKILSFRNMIQRSFRVEELQILGTTVQNLVSR